MIRTCYLRRAVIWVHICTFTVKRMSVVFSPSMVQGEFSEFHLMLRSMLVMQVLYFVFFWGFVLCRLKLLLLRLPIRNRLDAVQILTYCRHLPNLVQP